MIDLSNERENMAYVGRRPWHGLGNELTPGADLDVWRVEAGLDWSVNRSTVRFDTDEEGETEGTMTDRDVLWRSDNQKALSVVSSGYKVLQPGAALEFFREFVAAGDMEIETAGSLDDGRRIWALARIGEDFTLMGQDRVSGFLLLATSFDGSMATTAKFTTVRVVCQNTLHMADTMGNQPTVRVPHSTSFDEDRVKTALGIRESAWADFGDLADELARTRVSPMDARRWLIDAFGDPSKGVDEQSEDAARLMQRVWGSVQDSPGSNLRSAGGTAWGLVNGATHYLDHARKYRSDNNRLSSNWFGEGAKLKQRALRSALKMVA